MSEELVQEETKVVESKPTEEKVVEKAKDPEYRTFRVKASDYVFITKTDLKYRYVAFLLVGIIGGAFVGGIYQAMVSSPNYNPPSNGNGNGNNTNTTIPTTQSAFILIPYEEPAVLFKCGYEIRDNNHYLRFEVNIREVRGYAGTCKLQCTIWTDMNHWTIYESYGGIFEKPMAASQIVERVEVLFDVPRSLYEVDGLDFTTATVKVVY